MRATKKELQALIVTLQQLHEATGDAEAFGLSTPLSSYAIIIFLPMQESTCFLCKNHLSY